jgi:coproporphyrinogen III oxidase-like Fe-S oxidoreductase
LAGLSWYELSNWSKPGHQCRHNVAYWRNANWWGLGPGAHSHLNGVRWWNVKHPTRYKEMLFEKIAPVHDREVLTVQQKKDEAIMLAIRMRDGIAMSELSADQKSQVAEYRDTGHLDDARWQVGTLQLTAKGRLIADRIVRELVV